MRRIIVLVLPCCLFGCSGTASQSDDGSPEVTGQSKQALSNSQLCFNYNATKGTCDTIGNVYGQDYQSVTCVGSATCKINWTGVSAQYWSISDQCSGLTLNPNDSCLVAFYPQVPSPSVPIDGVSDVQINYYSPDSSLTASQFQGQIARPPHTMPIVQGYAVKTGVDPRTHQDTFGPWHSSGNAVPFPSGLPSDESDLKVILGSAGPVNLTLTSDSVTGDSGEFTWRTSSDGDSCPAQPFPLNNTACSMRADFSWLTTPLGLPREGAFSASFLVPFIDDLGYAYNRTGEPPAPWAASVTLSETTKTKLGLVTTWAKPNDTTRVTLSAGDVKTAYVACNEPTGCYVTMQDTVVRDYLGNVAFTTQLLDNTVLYPTSGHCVKPGATGNDGGHTNAGQTHISYGHYCEIVLRAYSSVPDTIVLNGKYEAGTNTNNPQLPLGVDVVVK
jgi:hypothetical protein